MAVRSHVDMCLFVRFMHVRPPDRAPGLDALLLDPRNRVALSEASQLQARSNQRVFFHEAYHYWQGLRLPFLYRYAVLSLRVVAKAFHAMAIEGGDLHEWDCMLPELYRLNLNTSTWLREDGVAFGRPGKPPAGVSGPPTATYAPIDLLETAASMAEFQVFGGAPTDVEAFERWAKRHPTYRIGYEFAARALGAELALTATMPLINGAFQTSEPERAFGEEIAWLLAIRRDRPALLADFFATPEPREWQALVKSLLRHLRYQSQQDDGEILGSPFHRIELADWLLARGPDGQPLTHPFLTRSAHKWEELERESPGADALIDLPGYVAEESMETAIGSIAPELTLTRFHGAGDTDRVVTSASPSYDTQNLSTDLRFLTMYSTVRRASGANFDADHRLCPHRSCPEWQPNYCNSYPAVPADWRECGFRRLVDEMRDTVRARSGANKA